jgi:uncharacterized protein HemX
VGIYLAALLTAAIIAMGIWAFVGLNRQEQMRLRQAAPAPDTDAPLETEERSVAEAQDGPEPQT